MNARTITLIVSSMLLTMAGLAMRTSRQCISRIIRQWPRQDADLSNLIEELKRRNVIRVGLAYLVAAWVVLQIADLVLENIGAPDWVMQTLMLVSALGFPVVLLFSWAFELTPEGIKREKDVAAR